MHSRIILAYSNAETDPVAHGAVRRALPPGHEVKLTAGEAGYGELFRALWLEGQPFIIVEHDVVPAPGMLAQLDGCSCAWCGHGYGPTDTAYDASMCLGLVAFRPLGDVPFEAMEPGEEARDEDGLPTAVPHYTNVAAVVRRSLVARGWEFHMHTPPVTHLEKVPHQAPPPRHVTHPRSHRAARLAAEEAEMQPGPGTVTTPEHVVLKPDAETAKRQRKARKA